MIEEIATQEIDAERFINGKVMEIQAAVGDGIAINALSGGVDSSTVTMLGHRALESRLTSVFIENGLMQEGEADQVAGLFRKLGVMVHFPGPALSARVIGEATPERIETVRRATVVVERLLKDTGAFQYMAILSLQACFSRREDLQAPGGFLKCK